MEKGVEERASFLCVVVSDAIILGVVLACFINLNGYSSIRDPTYQEALQFISSDQTDKNQYSQSYICINFANDFVDNALNEGYRCGLVIIEFPETRHAIVCFNTSDKGLIFIEPQNDALVTLTTEQRFSITWCLVSEFLYMLVLSFLIPPLFMITTLLAVIAYKRKHSM